MAGLTGMILNTGGGAMKKAADLRPLESLAFVTLCNVLQLQ